MPATAGPSRPEDLVARLSADGPVLLKSLKEIKNQIIGNKTKKLVYLHLGAVPTLVAILATADPAHPEASQVLVQCAAALGSFACGVDAGVRALLDADVVPHLTRILSVSDEKVVDAGARSLRMIFQSKLAPKYDFFQDKHMKFLLLLLNSDNENMTELAASITTHSCETSMEQKLLSEAGVLERLVHLLGGSLNQRDASLDSIAAIVKNNSEVVSKFVSIGNGKALRAIVELIKDRYSRTRLLACICLIVIGHASPCHLQELEIKAKLIMILIELLEEPGRVGDEAPFALAKLTAGNEELHKQAISINAVEKLCNFLRKDSTDSKRVQGILLALSELCSGSENSRCQLISLQGLEPITDALRRESVDLQIAACACLRSISRSVKKLSAGFFNKEPLIRTLINLLLAPSTSVQVAALGVISNIVVHFSTVKSVFISCEGMKELVGLSSSMDSAVRLKAVWALRNLMYHADKAWKEELFLEMTESALAALICDPEVSVQEQALALVRNIVDGCNDFIDHVLRDGDGITNAALRQICGSSAPGVCAQGMFFFSNIASGNEFHKDVVLNHLLSPECECPILLKFLQSTDNLLRIATVWCIINLTHPESSKATARALRLSEIGVVSQIKSMVDDPCLDFKFRVKTALRQIELSKPSCA